MVNYLHLPLNSFKRIGQCLGHSCCQTAINEVLKGREARRWLLPELAQVHVYHIATNRKREGTCQMKPTIRVKSTTKMKMEYQVVVKCLLFKFHKSKR